MLMLCPSCDKRICTANQSRFDVFTCECGRQFRGIHADIDMVNNTIWSIGQVLVPLWKTVIGTREICYWHTACPYCWIQVPLVKSSVSKGYNSPDYCYSCQKRLPTETVNHFVKYDEKSKKWVLRT